MEPETRMVETKTEDGLAVLACYSCKRRKVKCNRTLPVCSLCEKTGGPCEYPTHAEKPGPKAGTPQKNKRRRIGDRPSSIAERSQTLSDHAVSGGRERFGNTNTYVNVKVALPENSTAKEENGHSTAPTFSQIMYPSHELQTRPQSPLSPEPSPEQPSKSVAITIEDVCDGLEISLDTYKALMRSYFSNMTTFSLFRPGSIETKLALMRTKAEAKSLVAAIFSFAARFSGCPDYNGNADECPAPSYFSHIASTQLEKSLNEYGDETPPLWVLQTAILNTFYQLTRSVRSRSWRVLGYTIRLAYDMRLHLVDANHDIHAKVDSRNVELRRWSHQEERRRAWWAIWEMDVYASTIRRLPTAIDWGQNMTLLPVHDNCWFNDIFQQSCFLNPDPHQRWKCLDSSGNNSPRAWFIVINSLMRNTQLRVYPLGTALRSPSDHWLETRDADLSIMANTVYCTSMSLPHELAYNGETLDFRSKYSTRDISNRQYHCDKYSIHLMTQLSRFMIYHHKICGQAPWLNKEPQTGEQQQPSSDQVHSIPASEWSNYINAADEIVGVIRNSAKDHYKYVNPFLCNTVWFAASAQCALKVFGPATFDKRVADSNLALLRLTIDRFISFWGCADTLKDKLSRMEAGLKKLMARQRREGADGNLTSTQENNQRQQSSSAGTSAHQLHSAHLPLEAIASTSSTLGYTPGSSDSVIAHYQTPASDQPSLGYQPSALDAAGMLDPNTALLPNFYDVQTFDFADPAMAFLGGPPADYFPYGLEEILLYGGSSGFGLGTSAESQQQ